MLHGPNLLILMSWEAQRDSFRYACSMKYILPSFPHIVHIFMLNVILFSCWGQHDSFGHAISISSVLIECRKEELSKGLQLVRL